MSTSEHSTTSFEQTDLFWEQLKTQLLSEGWKQEEENYIVRRYTARVFGSYEECHDEIKYCETQSLMPEQWGNGRELRFYPYCSRDYCEYSHHFIWKINVDDKRYYRYNSNDKTTWRMMKTFKLENFQSDFKNCITEVDRFLKKYTK